MTNRLLSVAAGTLRGAEPVDMVIAVARAGFDAIGFGFEHRYLSPRELAEIARRLEDTAISVLDIEVVRIAPNDDNEVARRLVEYGAVLGAKHLLVVSNDGDQLRTADRFAEICAIAADAKIRPVLEFMAFTSVTSLDSAVAIVEQSGAKDGGVLIDSLHLARCGDLAKDIASFPPDLFPYAQISDGPARAPSTRDLLANEARHERLMPGDGDLSIGELILALPPMTALSIEVLSDALDDLDLSIRTSLTMEASRKMLESIGEVRVSQPSYDTDAVHAGMTECE